MTLHRFPDPRLHPERDLPHPAHGQRIDCSPCRVAAWDAYKARVVAWEARRDAHGQRTHRVRDASGVALGLLVVASPFLLIWSGLWLGLVQGALDLLVLAFYPILGLGSGTIPAGSALVALAVGWALVVLVSWSHDDDFGEPMPRPTRAEYDAFWLEYAAPAIQREDPAQIGLRARRAAEAHQARRATQAAQWAQYASGPGVDDLPF